MSRRKKDEVAQAAVYTIPVTLTVFEWARLLRVLHREHPDRPLLDGIHKAVQQDEKLSDAVKWLRTYDEADRLVRLYGRKPAEIRQMLSSGFGDLELQTLAAKVPKSRKSRRLAGDKKVAK